METAARRVLRDGSAYDGLFPKATGKDSLVREGAGLEDTLRTIPKVVREYGWQAREIARVLEGASLQETCRNIWNFLYRHVQYRQDAKGKEQLRTPARLWMDRKSGVDCDCYSIFISCVLTNLGIRHSLRVTKYPDLEYGDPDPPFSHIYVVCGADNRQTIIIDPVTDSFNYEVPFLAKKEIRMDLEILNGIPPGGGYSPSSVDCDDLMAHGLGTVSPALQNSAKYSRIEREAAEKGMTVQQYQAWTNQEFTRQNGVPPEQFAANVRSTIATEQARGNAQDAREMEAMRAELTRRRIKFPPGATRDELLNLLKSGAGQGTGGRVANVVNKFNPATVAVRTGILIAMKVNYLGVARKLRYGYMTQGQAMQAGVDGQNWQKAREVLSRLEKIHHTAGGDINHLRKAILDGKGNRDGAVPLMGLGLMGPSAGLGEPVTATVALTAATTVLAAVAAAAKTINDGKKAQQEESSTAVNPAEAEQAVREMESQAPEPGTGSGDLLPLAENREAAPPADPEPPKKGIGQWIKDNPVLTGAIVVGTAAAAYMGYTALRPKPAPRQTAGQLSGTPKGKGKKKKGGSPRGKGVRVVRVP